MGITLDWLGCATFRLTIDGLVVFLDAYMDRVPSAPPVGLSSSEVDRADFILVGHSHFDHIAGAEVIAQNTGAVIIGSNESCHVMRQHNVPREQLRPSQGGERHRLSPDVTVRVYPSLHACLWAGAPNTLGEECVGDLGLTEDERRALMAERNPFADVLEGDNDIMRAIGEHMRTATGSLRDGGPLAYLIETPYGTIFYQDTSGAWTGLLHDLRCDAAILAASARPQVDGEPYQGSIASFVAMEAGCLRAREVVLGHHDNWIGRPDFTPFDLTPLKHELSRTVPRATLIEQDYLAGAPLLA